MIETSVMKEFKVDSYLLEKNCFICFNESPSNMMKNAFYFTLEALFVLKIFNFFVLTFWSYIKNGLTRKIG